MSEITKLFENAGIKTNKYKLCCTGCKHIAKVEVINGYPSKWICDKYDEVANCDKAEPDYQPFTAEKQLKILCFIVNNKHSVTFHDQIFGGDKLTLEKIQENLAWAINRIWQDLTEEEKQQVKGILE